MPKVDPFSDVFWKSDPRTPEQLRKDARRIAEETDAGFTGEWLEELDSQTMPDFDAHPQW